MATQRFIQESENSTDGCYNCQTCCVDGVCKEQDRCNRGFVIGYILTGTLMALFIMVLVVLLICKCKKEYKKFKISEEHKNKKRQLRKILEKTGIIKGIPYEDQLPPFKSCKPYALPRSIDEISLEKKNLAIDNSNRYDLPSNKRPDQRFTVYDFRSKFPIKLKSLRDRPFAINIDQIKLNISSDISQNTESVISARSMKKKPGYSLERSSSGNQSSSSQSNESDSYSISGDDAP
ncbi:unnamed protein product [Moneuplotes crassus]|uniref:Uncharacterized protein n=1 Tax=Euplotes crassus TaxID=5936 RepID=A0AAD1XRF9_EUPCR|nr:unnamed protein product [Moneuplotes crassus]